MLLQMLPLMLLPATLRLAAVVHCAAWLAWPLVNTRAVSSNQTTTCAVALEAQLLLWLTWCPSEAASSASPAAFANGLLPLERCVPGIVVAA
jgi:hypothetical protein